MSKGQKYTFSWNAEIGATVIGFREELREISVDCLPDICKQSLSLFFCTYNNNIEHPAIESSYSAEIENAVFPDCFKRVTKNMLFSLAFGI